MDYDPALGELVLFGGYNAGSGRLAETWTYDGSTWTQQSPAMSPPPRAMGSMAYDPAIGKLVLFGGGTGSSPFRLADTWTYDGSTWTQQSPGMSPPARTGASMAYDPAIGKLVLFGGDGISTMLADTWTYDGSTWTQQSPAINPGPHWGASMAYDPAIGKVVLFGGSSPRSALADTWIYDGTAWAKQSPATSPPARTLASMAYDPAIGDLLLFGGSPPFLAETWTFDGATWTMRSPATSPPARDVASMAFDPTTAEMVLFGGYGPNGELGDTWTYGFPSGIAAPTAKISSPDSHQSYTLDQVVGTSFGCFEAPGGPGISSCIDSDGSESPGKLDTSTLGSHVYTVTATSADGKSGEASIEYTILKATPTFRHPCIVQRCSRRSGHGQRRPILWPLPGRTDNLPPLRSSRCQLRWAAGLQR